MKVHGITITPEQIAAAETLTNGGRFTLAQVEKLLEAHGVPRTTERDFQPVLMRAADRLLQKWKREGKIRWTGSYWERV
jgi:hypothetical protein